jgi:hypothetical protein
MNTIDLQKDGALTQKAVEMKADPLPALGYRLHLTPACTLRSYFGMLEKYPVFTRLSQFIPPAVDQYMNCPKSGCTTPGLDAVELGKTIEMVGFPGDPKIDSYLTFMGIHAGEALDIKSSGMAQLLDMRLQLGKLKHVVFGDEINAFEFDTAFSLFEFIEGLSWQLSFHYDAASCRIKT